MGLFLCDLALKQGQADISYEGPDSIIGFAGLTVVTPLTQSCCCNAKAIKCEWMTTCSQKCYFQM